MDPQDVLGQAREAMTVKRVFGDPVERDGTTIVPVARVMGGSGFGSGTQPGSSGESDDPGQASTGMGGGFGLRATPAGVYVIKGGEVTWQPAVSPERMVLVAGVIAFLILIGVRSIVKALLRR